MVRLATPGEFARLRWVELESDKLMEQVGIGPFPEDDGGDRLSGASVVFASGDPAVGFVSVRPVDDGAHVDQLSVLPANGRRGIGRALLDRAVDWARDEGLAGVTLTTFRDVPWNAPFYRTVGFEVVAHPAPGLGAIRTHERAVGLDALGPRVAMRLEC
ncbi:MAG TPA: GNAT family N-acetyltransferase [Acidimicrobiales bacterium]